MNQIKVKEKWDVQEYAEDKVESSETNFEFSINYLLHNALGWVENIKNNNFFNALSNNGSLIYIYNKNLKKKVQISNLQVSESPFGNFERP